MTQEDRELLLKDLCARLPYGVKILARNPITKEDEVQTIDAYKWGYFECSGFGHRADIVKPYLRPLSSMTDEEINEFILISDTVLWLGDKRSTSILSLEQMDWLNKNMFDYRGLIPMGHALEAKEGMYKSK